MFNFKGIFASTSKAAEAAKSVQKKAIDVVKAVKNTDWNAKAEDAYVAALDDATQSACACGDRWTALADKYAAEGNLKKAAYCAAQAEKSYRRGLKAAEDLAAKEAETAAEPEAVEETEVVVEPEAEMISKEEYEAAWRYEMLTEILGDVKCLEAERDMIMASVRAGEVPDMSMFSVFLSLEKDYICYVEVAMEDPLFDKEELRKAQERVKKVHKEVVACFDNL